MSEPPVQHRPTYGKKRGGTFAELQRLEATMQGELADIRLEMDQFVKSLLKAQAQARANSHAAQRSNGGEAELRRQVSQQFLNRQGADFRARASRSACFMAARPGTTHAGAAAAALPAGPGFIFSCGVA